MNETAEPVWRALREAAASFCPPLVLAEERPRALAVSLRDPESGDELRVRYRSERGLFLRTYFLVAEADVPGTGPSTAGRLVLRGRGFRWMRPKPADARRWSDSLGSTELRTALARMPVERLALVWDPERATWRFSLETLAGSLTVTFFPPLMTPNPLRRDEAGALVDAVRAFRSASARTPA